MDTGSLAKSHSAKGNNSQGTLHSFLCVKRCLWEMASELGMLVKFVLRPYQVRMGGYVSLENLFFR